MRCTIVKEKNGPNLFSMMYNWYECTSEHFTTESITGNPWESSKEGTPDRAPPPEPGPNVMEFDAHGKPMYPERTVLARQGIVSGTVVALKKGGDERFRVQNVYMSGKVKIQKLDCENQVDDQVFLCFLF